MTFTPTLDAFLIDAVEKASFDFDVVAQGFQQLAAMIDRGAHSNKAADVFSAQSLKRRYFQVCKKNESEPESDTTAAIEKTAETAVRKMAFQVLLGKLPSSILSSDSENSDASPPRTSTRLTTVQATVLHGQVLKAADPYGRTWKSRQAAGSMHGASGDSSRSSSENEAEERKQRRAAIRKRWGRQAPVITGNVLDSESLISSGSDQSSCEEDVEFQYDPHRRFEPTPRTTNNHIPDPFLIEDFDPHVHLTKEQRIFFSDQTDKRRAAIGDRMFSLLSTEGIQDHMSVAEPLITSDQDVHSGTQISPMNDRKERLVNDVLTIEPISSPTDIAVIDTVPTELIKTQNSLFFSWGDSTSPESKETVPIIDSNTLETLLTTSTEKCIYLSSTNEVTIEDTSPTCHNIPTVPVTSPIDQNVFSLTAADSQTGRFGTVCFMKRPAESPGLVRDLISRAAQQGLYLCGIRHGDFKSVQSYKSAEDRQTAVKQFLASAPTLAIHTAIKEIVSTGNFSDRPFIAFTFRGMKATEVLRQISGPIDPVLARRSADSTALNAVYGGGKNEPAVFPPSEGSNAEREIKWLYPNGGLFLKPAIPIKFTVKSVQSNIHIIFEILGKCGDVSLLKKIGETIFVDLKRESESVESACQEIQAILGMSCAVSSRSSTNPTASTDDGKIYSVVMTGSACTMDNDLPDLLTGCEIKSAVFGNLPEVTAFFKPKIPEDEFAESFNTGFRKGSSVSLVKLKKKFLLIQFICDDVKELRQRITLWREQAFVNGDIFFRL